MKKAFMIVACMCLTLTYSCTNSGKISQGEKAQAQNRQCYMAVFEQDTAYLNISTMNTGKVTGDLVIHYAQKPKNEGTLEGKFIGDTLFADYSFSTGQSKDLNRNPLAFLREGSKLTLGVGVIEVYLGRAYLAKNPPINFSKGRFKFNPSNCQ